MRYTYTIRWGGESLSVTSECSARLAKHECEDAAVHCGWPGPRRWWEFWRWGDT